MQDRRPRSADTGRPRAIYARVLDGEHLWLAVLDEKSAFGTLALRRIKTGDVISMPTDVTPSEGQSLLSCCAALYGEGAIFVPGDEDELEFGVLDSPGSGSASAFRHVVAAYPREAAPITKTPSTSDDAWQFEIRAGDDNMMRLHCRKAERAALVDALSIADDTFVITCTVPVIMRSGAAPELRLRSNNRTDVARFDLVEDGDRHVGRVSACDVPLAPGQEAQVRVATVRTVVPLRRRRNDLVRPNRAVQLPELLRHERLPLRLSYWPDGSLAVRRLKSAASGR